MKRTGLILLSLAIAACVPQQHDSPGGHGDPHSWSRPDEVAVEHLNLDVTADFETRRIHGRATLLVDNKTSATELWLDTRDLDIERVTLDDATEEVPFTLGDERPFMGRSLTIPIAPDTRAVHIDYASRPGADALQWLEPDQTTGGRHPFLLSQSQSILARTWIPCQDSPGVRMTYDATVRVPPGLIAVMSAENPRTISEDGVYTFKMPQPIPAYLLALAVGELEYRPLGPRSGVYAEPEVIESAAYEFAETEKMIAAAEKLYGPYRWGIYDMVVLPASFPYGGMENPRLTFVTPTILAGDRSLVSLIAHELAHSWSGNLVTNATWNDFWLNESFTSYFEYRIMEEVYGREYTEMLALLARQELLETIAELGPTSPDTQLLMRLDGRDPDDTTDIAYEKGYSLLRLLEETYGRERWDAFLRDYFERFAFQSMTTDRLVAHLRAELIEPGDVPEAQLRLEEWVYRPGFPENAPAIVSGAFADVERQLEAWVNGTPPSDLETDDWSSHEWRHFVIQLPDSAGAERLAELDAAFRFSETGNSEVLHAWLMKAIDRGYEAAYPSLEAFLTGMGRRKFLKPLYTELARTPDGEARARRIYELARPGYHPVSSNTIDEILGWPWN